jgi:aryl-alcohol dehydrogenase-like predicted oxidoreductase
LPQCYPKVPIEDTVVAPGDLIGQGKIGHIGPCEAPAGAIRQAHAVHPVTAVQPVYSLWTRDPEAAVLLVTRELGLGLRPILSRPAAS